MEKEEQERRRRRDVNENKFIMQWIGFLGKKNKWQIYCKNKIMLVFSTTLPKIKTRDKSRGYCHCQAELQVNWMYGHWTMHACVLTFVLCAKAVQGV